MPLIIMIAIMMLYIGIVILVVGFLNMATILTGCGIMVGGRDITIITALGFITNTAGEAMDLAGTLAMVIMAITAGMEHFTAGFMVADKELDRDIVADILVVGEVVDN